MKYLLLHKGGCVGIYDSRELAERGISTEVSIGAMREDFTIQEQSDSRHSDWGYADVFYPGVGQ